MDADQVFEFLKSRAAFFKGFSEEQLKRLAEGSHVTTFEPNEAVIEFGEEGRFMGILMDGEAEVSVTDDSGEKHILGVLKAGDVFGEMALMTGDKTMADVLGLSRCTALLIPEGLFSTVLITYPPAIKSLSKMITDRLKSPAYEETQEELSAAAFRRSEDPYGFKLKTEEPMKVLVLGCGPTSLRYNLFDTADPGRNAQGAIEKIGEEGTRHTLRFATSEVARALPRAGHREALASMLKELAEPSAGVIKSADEITAVGHRVLNGGTRFTGPVLITDEVFSEIKKLADLAPRENPAGAAAVWEARALFPKAHHVAVFETAFHHTLPPYAYLYGLPYEDFEAKGIRRYGFNGMSHAYVSLTAAAFLKRPYNELEMITCHLGHGASICAVDHGRSVDTSMGFSPAEGLIMGTRSGNVDPGILVHLMRTENLTAEDLDRLINKESGFLGISGISNDMLEIEAAARDGHHRALLAFKTFCYQIRKYIGAYIAAMGGLDVIVFTGGIGQGSPGVRSLACQGLSTMGIEIDEEKNRRALGSEGICVISADGSPVSVLIVPTDEERMVARETLRLLRRQHVTTIIRSQVPLPVPIEVSAHHVHLAQPHVDALYGPGHRLTPEHELSQPGQFACTEKVNLVGPKGRVERVRVLGPTRKETQIEISMTEQFTLGIHPPIRESGDLKNSPGAMIEGPSGKVMTDKGVICALRHIHMTPEDALRFGLHDRDMVRVRVEGDRELIFGDVVVRVNPNFKLAMHLDTDEANAANLKTGVIGYIDGIQSRT
jgi:acetate kinase